MVFWTWSEVFDALDFRIALVRVGRGASCVETDRIGTLILWIAPTKCVFERADSVDETVATKGKEETGGMVLGMASVFHAMVFCVALVRVEPSA